MNFKRIEKRIKTVCTITKCLLGGEREIYMGGSMGERVFFVVRVKFRIFSRLSVGVTQRKNEENNKLIKQNKTVFNTETKTEEDNLLRLINIFL
jgi:hypothetical protein